MIFQLPDPSGMGNGAVSSLPLPDSVSSVFSWKTGAPVAPGAGSVAGADEGWDDAVEPENPCAGGALPTLTSAQSMWTWIWAVTSCEYEEPSRAACTSLARPGDTDPPAWSRAAWMLAVSPALKVAHSALSAASAGY